MLLLAIRLSPAAAGRCWEVRSAGNGSKGRRWYAWAWLARVSPRHYLLIRRHLATGEIGRASCRERVYACV